MGFFSKLFEKKVCDLCGGEIGLLGNRKLEDGNCCKECAAKLSPWFDDRRHSTVEQICDQLNYREENRRKLEQFRPVKSYGEDPKLRVELENGVPKRFVVERTDNYLEENADLIEFSQVTSFDIEIDESEEEQQYRNDQDELVSYNPPRYEYSYDFNLDIHINSPYFDNISFSLNSSTLVLEHAPGSARVGNVPLMMNTRQFKPTLYPEYREYKALCDEVEQLFQAGVQGTTLPGEEPPAPAADPEPVAEPEIAPAAGPKFCSNCGAAVEGGKFCQYCGSAL